jgi:Anaerobic dehydrogenases, typically selenocysteine-containing
VDKQTLKIQKFEGNPEHPGSRGRNCAKGPATLNQVQDPERIRYPLKRVGQRGEGKWERVTWDEVLDDIAGRIRSALVEGRQKEIMYHLGRPGHELVYLQRVFHAWGIDGHNSHTNVCSASARAGYAFWHGFDRPSPDHGRARFILLLSSHLEAGHYFNSPRPANHRRQDGGGQGVRGGHASEQHRLHGGLLAVAVAGDGGRVAPRLRPRAAARGHVGSRVRPPVGELGGIPDSRAAGRARQLR